MADIKKPAKTAEGSNMGNSNPLIGTGAFADNIPAESKIYPVVGQPANSFLIKGLSFNKVSK